jgi:hypothetical protein
LSVQRLAPLDAYIPAGLSADKYRKIEDADKKKLCNNLGGLGPRGFKSRSIQSWQEAYERAETGHSMVPFGYRNALKNGEIKKEDVPYMVRGGSCGTTVTFSVPSESSGRSPTKGIRSWRLQEGAKYEYPWWWGWLRLWAGTR